MEFQTIKTCKVCGETKPRSEFTSTRSECKPCYAALSRERRNQNPDKHREYARNWRKRNPDKVRESDKRQNAKRVLTPEQKEKARLSIVALRERRREEISALKRVCGRCGGRFLAVCLDFDHRDPANKYRSVSNMALSSPEKLAAELEKCDIICACCHRTKTKNTAFPYAITCQAWILEILKEIPCLDCNVMWPPEAMDFDHRDPETKSFSVSRRRNYSVKRLSVTLEEIAKCDLVCANCHRIRTAGVFEWRNNAHP